LDKQRADTAAMLAVQSQMATAFNQGATDGNACAGMPSADARRDCEANVSQMRRRLADQQAREEQLRAQQRDLENALSAEQARWSEFNSRLDELERALR
jgi:septal ring factor EnvC (AmiA/AmiB activator)